MPSRKQRRRREKLQRHEYEYVIETEDGEEVPVERPEATKGDSKKPARTAPQRGGRQVPKPSLGRVAKRTAIFAPIIVVVVWVFTASTVSTTAKIFNAVALIAFFIPFSYLLDVIMYRAFSKRQRGSG